MSDCKHSWITLYRTLFLLDEYALIKWCKVCGAVVIDLECDGIIESGGLVKVKLPENYEGEI